jgi:hypothetical protein
MRPRTLHRRGQFYRRRRSHWRLNLALVLIGAALAGFVVLDMRVGGPAPGPEDTAKRIAAPAPTALAAISAPPPRPGQPGALVAGPAPDRRVPSEIRANRRAFDGAGARLGVTTVRDEKAIEPAPVPRTPAPSVMRSPTPPEGCKTCGDEVPF